MALKDHKTCEDNEWKLCLELQVNRGAENAREPRGSKRFEGPLGCMKNFES